MRSRRSLASGAVLAAVVVLGGGVHAACAPPAPPDPATRPAKPAAPVKGPCVDAKPGTPGCLGWEAYSFSDEVKTYNAKIPAFQAAANAYVAKLNEYVKASNDYARCEVQALQ